MSNKSIFYTLVILFSICEKSVLQKVEKRLSPIQVKSDEAKLVPQLDSDKSTQKNIITNIKDSIKGEVVKMASTIKPNSLEEDSDYDSLDDIQYADEENHDDPIIRGKKNVKQWDHWGKWSECSASCGVGKMTRWRHCVSEGCGPGEKEAQIKTCALKSCP